MRRERYLTNDKEEKRFKIIIVGDGLVGKTALFWRFTQGNFLSQREPQLTTIDFKIKNVTIKSKPVKLYIWDTAGQERYRSIVTTYFKGCHGVLMVFDLAKQQSFRNIREQWYEICQAKADKAKLLLVGNKADLDVRVREEEVREWCKAKNIPYISTSVKEGRNVEEAFMLLATAIAEGEQCNPRTVSFMLKNKVVKANKKCC